MGARSMCASVRSTTFGTLLGAALAAPGDAQVTHLASLGPAGTQANSWSDAPAITADGRRVAFESEASNLVAGDTNGCRDVFLRDRQSGLTERISVDSNREQGNDQSFHPSMSLDGRYVAFDSFATNLAPGDANGSWDVLIRDRQSGLTQLVSVGTGGNQGGSASQAPSLSADGRYVAFQSYASDLVPGDFNGAWDVFVRDRQTGLTEIVSLHTSGALGDDDCGRPAISSDGRYVAFQSLATNLVAGDTNSCRDVFVRDRVLGRTERASVDSLGTQGNGHSGWDSVSISATGRYVAFESQAGNLVAGDTNATIDVFVRDRLDGLTERLSVATGGAQASSASFRPSTSIDGRYAVFHSYAADLVPGDTNVQRDVFVRDRHAGTTERVSVSSTGAQGSGPSDIPTFSPDGRFVAFTSSASDLVPGDLNGAWDVLVRDRAYLPIRSHCDPGTAGVIACPCANPPSGPGRGCDNSAGTGGAVLSATGVAFLSQDTLVFTTSGERPATLSIVGQWTGSNSGGIAFGMGVRCTSSMLKRLYTKIAVGGCITAPEVGVGDQPVSVRSAALGDAIPPGQSRWYLVFYRDPFVLGGCPATSTFNATQTGQATWMP